MAKALLLPLALFSSLAGAQEAEKALDEPVPPRFDSAIKNADAGTFQAFTAPARIEGHGTLLMLSGYDESTKSAAMNVGAEMRVWGPLAVRVGATWVAQKNTIAPTAGLRVQALRQERFGIDLSVGGQYKPEGLTEGSGEGELESVVAIGRRFGRLGLLGNIVYGQDFEGKDRDGEIHVSALYTFHPRVRAGFDSRVRFDLGSNAANLAVNHKSTMDAIAGPSASVLFGPAAFVATVGYSGAQLYGVSGWTSGAIAIGGIAAGF